jgi:hypothetical protein
VLPAFKGGFDSDHGSHRAAISNGGTFNPDRNMSTHQASPKNKPAARLSTVRLELARNPGFPDGATDCG